MHRVCATYVELGVVSFSLLGLAILAAEAISIGGPVLLLGTEYSLPLGGLGLCISC